MKRFLLALGLTAVFAVVIRISFFLVTATVAFIHARFGEAGVATTVLLLFLFTIIYAYLETKDEH